MANTPDPPGGHLWVEYFTSLVKSQDERKASIEQRGLAVVTTSGTLVTLLFGIASLLTRGDDFVLPARAHLPLDIALVLFVVAAIGGLMTNAPLWGKYQTPDPDGFDRIFDEYWDKPLRKTQIRVSAARGMTYRAAERANEWKGRILLGALGCEVLAVLSLSVALRIVALGA